MPGRRRGSRMSLSGGLGGSLLVLKMKRDLKLFETNKADGQLLYADYKSALSIVRHALR